MSVHAAWNCTAAVELNEELRIRCWRLEYLRRLGFTEPDARRLARSRIDLHELERLLRLGCPPRTAARIVA